jgi:hypothetical protein
VSNGSRHAGTRERWLAGRAAAVKAANEARHGPEFRLCRPSHGKPGIGPRQSPRKPRSPHPFPRDSPWDSAKHAAEGRRTKQPPTRSGRSSASHRVAGWLVRRSAEGVYLSVCRKLAGEGFAHQPEDRGWRARGWRPPYPFKERFRIMQTRESRGRAARPPTSSGRSARSAVKNTREASPTGKPAEHTRRQPDRQAGSEP